jgi:predicted nucleotidyltransferase
MGMSDPVGEFLEQVRKWGRNTTDISAVILVGSHARGEARPDSDIDLVIIAENPERYFLEHIWLKNFGQSIKTKHEDWGLVQSLRVWYDSGLEIEFGFTSKDWISEPLDTGTQEVLGNGYRFIINKANYSPEALG